MSPHDEVVVEIVIRREKETGRVSSEHRLKDESAHEIVAAWPSGGLEQVAFAILAEAVRREALLDVILHMSHHQAEWAKASESEREAITNRLTQAVKESMNGTIGRLAGSATRAALDLVTSSS